LLGCLAPAAPAPAAALGAGAVLALLVQCFDHVSGSMFNPAVTLAAALLGRVGWRRAAAYAAAQVAGGVAGAAALRALLGAGAAAACVPAPAAALGAARAAAVEALLAACLALANAAAWDARNRRWRDSWPLRVGAVVAALALVGGPLTGASMNPARSLGPALCSGNWQHHWVYWAGPLAGAGAAALLYRAVWAAPPAPPARPCCAV
ncbi:uncharacterized protein LOC126367680, partial [Pectinophora gossypiella]|uniref:uncharacterized protein LOC126367680 n=1 Tax=Pectinophora gossypiella TaxID=13191 RepID=UPI00214EEC9A